MSLHSRRSSLTVHALFAAGVVALAAAGCASQGTTPGQTTTTGALGSQTASSAASAASATSPASDSTSTSPSDPASSTSLPDADTSSSTNAPGKLYKLTDVVTEGGFKLKIHSITMPYHPPAGSYFTPGPTREWLLLDFEVTNVSGQESMFSTIGGFDVRDSAKASYLTSIPADEDLPKTEVFQDHEMKPGETSHGKLIFELSQQASGYRLVFNGNMWHASTTPPSITLGF